MTVRVTVPRKPESCAREPSPHARRAEQVTALHGLDAVGVSVALPCTSPQCGQMQRALGDAGTDGAVGQVTARQRRPGREPACGESCVTFQASYFGH